MVYSFINNCWTKHNLIYPLKATSSPKAVHKFPEDEWLLQHTATSRRIRHSSSCHLFFPGSPLSCSTSQQQHQRKWFYSTKPTHSSLIIKEVVSTLTGGRHHHQLKKIMACNEKIPRNPPVSPESMLQQPAEVATSATATTATCVAIEQTTWLFSCLHSTFARPSCVTLPPFQRHRENRHYLIMAREAG